MSGVHVSRAGAGCSARRHYPIGAELSEGGVSFRVWAPAHDAVHLLLADSRAIPMSAEPDGYFRLDAPGLGDGCLYKFGLGAGKEPVADPASRYQPERPDGWSMVIDPARFAWRHPDWRGVEPRHQVVYELHIGTFTTEGTHDAARACLPLLKDIGVTCIELMPLNEFPGDFGWGYDGVLPYAPAHLYGTPDDLRAFIDAAHALEIGVILDVVYNHFGVGNRFSDFSPDYFTDRHENEWGRSINFDGKNSRSVREFVAMNARYWIDEFHFDGLRLDATQALNDDSDEHIIAAIAREARAAAPNRTLWIVGENEPQDPRLIRSARAGGYALDALWNDDFHHSAMVALTGRREAYYHDHHGRAQEFVSAAKFGFLFQGQRYDWQDAARGRPALDLGPSNFVHFLQNHDQIANSGTGSRLQGLGSPARVRALTALLLLGPQIPMLFQGEEFAASTPFFYFADHKEALAEAVRKGRIAFLDQFPSLNDEDFPGIMPNPADRSTFERCKLDWSERDANQHAVSLHRDLLRLRRQWQTSDGADTPRLDGSVFGQNGFILRFFAEASANQRLLLVNLGADAWIESLPDPLLAPPEGFQWQAVWSSEDLRYGGSGRRPGGLQERWSLCADCAVVYQTATADRRQLPSRSELEAWQDLIGNLADHRTKIR